MEAQRNLLKVAQVRGRHDVRVLATVRVDAAEPVEVGECDLGDCALGVWEALLGAKEGLEVLHVGAGLHDEG
jgi:hypothetical protein